MANVKLGSKAVGSIVKIEVDYKECEFIIVHQGRPSSLYDVSCDGTWLLMKDIYKRQVWNSTHLNSYGDDYEHSDIYIATKPNDFLSKFDREIRSQIKEVKIPYRPGKLSGEAVNSGSKGLSTQIFILSAREVGITQDEYGKSTIKDGAKLDYFKSGSGTAEKIAKYKEDVMPWWLRTPDTSNTEKVFRAFLIDEGGSAKSYYCSTGEGLRPAFRG